MLVNYTGQVELTFHDWLDTETGRTLHCIPGGGPYDVLPAGRTNSGDNPEDCPYFTAATPKKKAPVPPELNDELPSKAEKGAV